MGWYPEFDLNGEFIVQLIKNGNWEKPVYIIKTKNCSDLNNALLDVMEIVEKISI